MATLKQKRLLFKLPLDKKSSIHPDPAVPCTCLLILTKQGDLYFAQLNGRHLKFVRNNVAALLWITSKRFLVLDCSTHDLIFYKIDSPLDWQSDSQVQFVSILHFAFQFISSILLEFGLSLKHDDHLQLLNYIPSTGYLDFLAKREFFLRVLVDGQKRVVQVVSCLKLGKNLLGTSCPQLTLLYQPTNRKVFLISAQENEFLVSFPLKNYIPARFSLEANLISISPDFRWLVLATSTLEMFQIFLPVFQFSSWSHLHKASLHAACSSLRFQEDDVVTDSRKALRRVNALWEREVGDVIAKNNAKQSFTENGWVFASSDELEDRNSSREWRLPLQYQGYSALALHCTQTEVYVTANNSEGHILLGVKAMEAEEAIWMTFAQDCLITFPTAAPYPVTLFYPMSMAIIATDQHTGFQREIAEAAAPDPWEDLSENQVMELALMQDIVDKALDYLQRRFPDRLHFSNSNYPTQAAQAIAREYLEERNIASAREILTLVGLDVTGEMREVFFQTEIVEFRLWLKDALLQFHILLDSEVELFDYLSVLEAHLPTPICLAMIGQWSAAVRKEKLLQAAIVTKDRHLVGTFPLQFVWDFLVAEGDEERILSWIRGEPDFTDRPVEAGFCERVDCPAERESEAVNGLAFQENIWNEFARRKIFSQKDSANWQLYLRRLMNAFGEDHPFFNSINKNRLDFLPSHLITQFLDFCVEKRLISVIMDLADQPVFLNYLLALSQPIPEWLSLFLDFKKGHLANLEDLRDLTFKNARYCWGHDVTLERLLDLEETEVALGLIALVQNQWPPIDVLFDDSDWTKCLDLLQRQISKFPKLKEALFPVQLSEEERLNRNISAYQLLQASAPYDPRKLFGWQTTNSVNSNYRAAEMPSFSSTDLQDKFGYKKELDFAYYLKNSRPSFAYWSFVSNLSGDNFKDEMMAGRDMAFFLALFFYLDNTVVAACVSFLEMLGIESLSTRICIQAARRIHKYRQQVFCTMDSTDLVRDIFIELFKYGSEMAGGVMDDLVAATNAAVTRAGLYPAGWDATSHWTLVNQFAELFDLPMSLDYLVICAANNEWLNFVAYCELFQYAVTLVTPLLDHFPHPHIRANLRLIFQNVKATKQELHSRQDFGGATEGAPVNRNIRSALYARIGVMASDKTTTSSTSDEDVRGRETLLKRHNVDSAPPTDMVEALCLAQKSLHPGRELLFLALELHSPIYAMIASGEPGVDRMMCVAVNLFSGLSEEDMIRYRSAEDLPSSLFDFHWTRKHVESLVTFHAWRQELRLVDQAFALVARDSIIQQFLAVAADIQEREERTSFLQKLKKLMESLQRACQQSKPDKAGSREELEDFKWALEFGLSVWADLMAALKMTNELEWRGILQSFKETGVNVCVGKLRKEVGASLPEHVEKLTQDIATLSQSVQVDASRLMELKSLLRDFQQSSLWKNEAFRLEVWQSIFGRVHVELTEKQSTDELIDMLSLVVKSSDSLTEKCILYSIMWKLDDTDDRLRVAWEAKISFGLSSSLPLEEWMSNALIGAGHPNVDLQREILSLGAMSLAEFQPTASLGLERNAHDAMLEDMIACLLKEGNLTLAARLSLLFGHLYADLDGICTALMLAKRDITVEAIPTWIVNEVHNPKRKSSVVSRTQNPPMDIEESEDEVVLWLRKIAAVCSLGRDVVTAILDNYCFAQFLQVGFEDMLLYSTSQVLERLFAVPSLERLSLAKRCLVSFKANTVEVTAFISSYVTEMLKNGLVKPNADPKSLGDSIKPYLTVALDLVSLGNHLIDAATGTRSDANLRLHTELLVAAHEVLTKAGTLEGLARLLAACKTVSKALADAQDYHSLLRLLNGVGRYSELTFIFHLIKEADKMEILFGRGVEKDPKLKNAILNYLRKFHADDSNTFEMLAAAYSMHREIGETFLAIAQDKMALFKHRPIVDTAETQAELKRIAQFLMDAANSFSRAECYSRTERCIEQARLVALQIVFLPTGLRLLSLNNPSGFVATHPRFAEAFIYAQAYGITEEWADAVYANYVINGDIGYLQDFLIKFEVTVALVAEVSRKFKMDSSRPPTAVIYMKKLLRQINDIDLAFKLANDLAINDLSMEILQVDGGAFLKDVMKF